MTQITDDGDERIGAVWGEEVRKRIGLAIKSARGRRSAQDIADRTAELGYPISRSQISTIERGKKRYLDIAELIILAAALGTAPIDLLLPDLPDGYIKIIPGLTETSKFAMAWITGKRSLADLDAVSLASLTLEREQAVEELASAGWAIMQASAGSVKSDLLMSPLIDRFKRASMVFNESTTLVRNKGGVTDSQYGPELFLNLFPPEIVERINDTK